MIVFSRQIYKHNVDFKLKSVTCTSFVNHTRHLADADFYIRIYTRSYARLMNESQHEYNSLTQIAENREAVHP